MRTKIGLAGIVGSIAVMMGFNFAHRLSVPLLIVMPLVCSASIAAGWLTAHRCLRARRKVHHIADDGEDEDEDEVPDELARSGGAGNCREVVAGFRRARRRTLCTLHQGTNVPW
jgi:hypothetical protein